MPVIKRTFYYWFLVLKATLCMYTNNKYNKTKAILACKFNIRATFGVFDETKYILVM